MSLDMHLKFCYVLRSVGWGYISKPMTTTCQDCFATKPPRSQPNIATQQAAELMKQSAILLLKGAPGISASCFEAGLWLRWHLGITISKAGLDYAKQS